MKTWNIIVKPNPKENFKAKVQKGEGKIILTGAKTTQVEQLFRTNIFAILDQNKLNPSAAVSDLLNLALSVYTVDQVISRASNGFQGWSRHLRLYVPVRLLAPWEGVKNELEELLSFLSGDKWEVYFRQLKDNEKHPLNPTSDISRVALFSGGLDSYISAINLLELGERISFVSHYKGGSESAVQDRLYGKLAKKYGSEQFVGHKIYVQPNQKHKLADKENSSRARSFLFLCLGLTFANCYGDSAEFIVPENGLISLNVPLTGTRLGSHSTRTTHPFFIQLFEKIVLAVGIKNSISNPYQFQTKGEMILSCKNLKLLKSTYGATTSCSHPDQSRYAGEAPGVHCGYCVPCIIRQAAELKGKVKKTKYVRSIKKTPPSPVSKSGSDLRAFKLGLEHLSSIDDHTIMFELLSAGPLPFNSQLQLEKYIDIYQRGMKEVKTFLKGK